MRHMVYIDDLIIIGYDRDEITAAQQHYITTVNNIQLLVKQSKVVQPATTGVDCLGVEVNGDDMTVVMMMVEVRCSTTMMIMMVLVTMTSLK
jgi:hypothetical protein